MDLQDRAQVVEELQREVAIAKATRPLLQGDWQKLSAKWCEQPACGLRIPDERRRALPGVKLCVLCQMRKERQQQTVVR